MPGVASGAIIGVVKPIILSDQAAVVLDIFPTADGADVELEWEGPCDHEVGDFELDRIGEVEAAWGTVRNGWVHVHGEPLVQVGDDIPVI